MPCWYVRVQQSRAICRFAGRELKGVHFAMEFLETCQRKQNGDDVDWQPMSAHKRKVIVLGGGDTATDCIGTAIRQVWWYFGNIMQMWYTVLFSKPKVWQHLRFYHSRMSFAKRIIRGRNGRSSFASTTVTTNDDISIMVSIRVSMPYRAR